MRREEGGIKNRWIRGLTFDVMALTRSWRHNIENVSTFRSLAVQSHATCAFVSQLLKLSSAFTPPRPEGYVSPMTWVSRST
jgi:hypothetical protein